MFTKQYNKMNALLHMKLNGGQELFESELKKMTKEQLMEFIEQISIKAEEEGMGYSIHEIIQDWIAPVIIPNGYAAEVSNESR